MDAREDPPTEAPPPLIRSGDRSLGRRRVLLLGGLAVGSSTLLSGCTLGARPEPLPPVHEPTPGVDPDVVVASDTLSAEQAMLRRVDAAIADHRGLRAVLAPVAAVHQAHVRLLTRAVPGSASPSPTPTPTSPASPAAAPPGSPAGGPSPTAGSTGAASPTPSTPAVPRKPDQALRWLAEHETDLSLFDKQQAFTARSGAFARLLASMAAAAAQQAVLLGTAAPRSGGPR